MHISSRDQVFIHPSIYYYNNNDKTTGLSLIFYCGIFFKLTESQGCREHNSAADSHTKVKIISFSYKRLWTKAARLELGQSHSSPERRREVDSPRLDTNNKQTNKQLSDNSYLLQHNLISFQTSRRRNQQQQSRNWPVSPTGYLKAQSIPQKMYT